VCKVTENFVSQVLIELMSCRDSELADRGRCAQKLAHRVRQHRSVVSR